MLGERNFDLRKRSRRTRSESTPECDCFAWKSVSTSHTLLYVVGNPAPRVSACLNGLNRDTHACQAVHSGRGKAVSIGEKPLLRLKSPQ